MHESEFCKFTKSLLRAGIAPRHARRIVREIRDHFDDIVDAKLAAGCDAQAARMYAGQELGELGALFHPGREAAHVVAGL